MNRLNSKLIVLILLLITLAVSVYIFTGDKREETIMTDSSLTLNAKLAGAWSSSYPEPNSSGLFAVRNFSFTGDNWSIDYTLYADAAASNPLFTFTGAGAYEIQSPSSVFENTHNALFKFNHNSLYHLNLLNFSLSFFPLIYTKIQAGRINHLILFLGVLLYLFLMFYLLTF